MTARPVSVTDASPLATHRLATQRRSTPKLLFLTLRPEQWTKNLLIFAGVLFSGRLRDVTAVWASLGTFAVFCALSSAVYVFNDVADRHADQQHPLKCARPIACGELAVPVAITAGAALALVALIAAFAISPAVGGVSAAYLVLLLENPLALTQLITLCTASPWVAELLTRYPVLLDELLRPLSRPPEKPEVPGMAGNVPVSGPVEFSAEFLELGDKLRLQIIGRCDAPPVSDRMAIGLFRLTNVGIF